MFFTNVFVKFLVHIKKIREKCETTYDTYNFKKTDFRYFVINT